jgi:drug/metabolite transporter (DMT)-like permease
MKKHTYKYNILLLLAATIWGFAFVAQRVGMQYIGAFTFNGVRFAIGSLSVIPVMIYFNNTKNEKSKSLKPSNVYIAGFLAGLILFLGSSFQQVGLIGTTAGKAGFITGLYIVIVPICGIFLKQYISLNSWLGAIIAVVGLYLLCVTGDFNISFSDLLELAGAFFFAFHILLIDYYSQKVDTLKLAFIQFFICSVLSMITAVLYESINFNDIIKASVPILYGGICSVGVAYTLQIMGQKNAKPSHAAIILSMESVFASIGGFIILNEHLGIKGFFGCTLMLMGMLLSQMKRPKKILQTSLGSD